MSSESERYFLKAQSWYEDNYLSCVRSRDHYRLALIWSGAVIILLLLAFLIVLPLKKTEYFFIHHSDDGTVWLENSHEQAPLRDQRQIESDLVRYVVNRESYSVAAYPHHYRIVSLLSDPETAKSFHMNQQASNPDSPIQKFSDRIIREIKIENVVFIDKDPEKPMAQVNYIAVDHDQSSGSVKKTPFLAIIAWRYRSPPKDPGSRWLNWDGFSVTHFSVEERTH